MFGLFALMGRSSRSSSLSKRARKFSSVFRLFRPALSLRFVAIFRIDQTKKPTKPANHGKRGSVAGNDAGRVMRKVALLLGMFALTDCAEKTIYLRTDGQDMVGNSALHEQFELDRVTCQPGLHGGQGICRGAQGSGGGQTTPTRRDRRPKRAARNRLRAACAAINNSA